MALLASNVFYPVSFTEVTLPTVKITIIDISQVTSTSATVRHNRLNITATCEHVDHTGEYCCGNICKPVIRNCWILQVEMTDCGNNFIHCSHSDNGFLMMPLEKISITFTSPDKFDVKTLQETLTIRYNGVLLMELYL